MGFSDAPNEIDPPAMAAQRKTKQKHKLSNIINQKALQWKYIFDLTIFHFIFFFHFIFYFEERCGLLFSKYFQFFF